MPQFDLRSMKIGKYVNNSGTVSYADAQTVGDAMNCKLELRFAEGRLYAESSLAEYLRKCVGGTISVGVKYIPNAAQQLMFGSSTKSRSISYIPVGSSTTTSANVSGLVIGAKSTGDYVGFACYAPDMIDGVEKYTCFFIPKVRFGAPGYILQTAGETIQFATPTTTGEFMANDAAARAIQEIAVCDDENEAIAWCTAVLA